MAISPVVTDCVQVRLIWSINGEAAINVLNFRASGAVVITQAFANTNGLAVKSAFDASWAPRCHPNVVLLTVGFRDLRTANGSEYRDTGASHAGTGTGEALPAANAVCVTLRTAKSGKSFRGRVYLPGASETDNDVTGRQSTTVQNSATAFVNDIATRLSVNGLTFAVLSRPAEAYVIEKTITHQDGTTTKKSLSKVTAKSGGLENVTLAQTRNSLWETQRRRQNGRATTILSFGAPTSSVEIGHA